MKWAFIYNVHRHIYAFAGPFDSYEDMMKCIAGLATDYDTNMGDLIGDYTSYESVEETFAAVGLKIFKVERVDFNQQEIFDMWKLEVAKYDEKWKRINEKQQEEHDIREYERLKKKFEGSN